MKDDIWEQVKQNRAKLEGCTRHHFTEIYVKIGQKQICETCGGQMSLTDIGNYIRGYVAAGKPATDIWPQWGKKS